MSYSFDEAAVALADRMNAGALMATDKRRWTWDDDGPYMPQNDPPSDDNPSWWSRLWEWLNRERPWINDD